MLMMEILLAQFLLLLFTCLVESNIIVLDPKNISHQQYTSVPSDFGPRLYNNVLDGYAVAADPIEACNPIAKPPYRNFTPPDDRFWIAIIQRLGCNFKEKILNAQDAGYQAAIVYNVGSDDLQPMHADDGSDVIIPSLFIGQTAGLQIRRHFLYNTRYYLRLTGQLPFNLNDYLLPFIIVIGVCFLVMVSFMVAKFARDFRRRRRSRLSSANLKKIPVKKFKKGDEYDVCAICLDEYSDGDKLRVLPCSHAYHTKCIDPWLTKNKRTCPVCKRKVIPGPDGESSESESDEDEGAPLLPSAGSSLYGSSNTARVSDNRALVAGQSSQSEGAVGGVSSSEDEEDTHWSTPCSSVTKDEDFESSSSSSDSIETLSDSSSAMPTQHHMDPDVSPELHVQQVASEAIRVESDNNNRSTPNKDVVV